MVNSLEGNDYTEVFTLTREKDKQREEKVREEATAAEIVPTASPTKKMKLKEKKPQNQLRTCLKL